MASDKSFCLGDLIKRHLLRILSSLDHHLIVAFAFCAWGLLGWQPDTTFEGLVQLMVDADLEQIS